MKWIDDIIIALEDLGGQGHLSQIYEIVKDTRTIRNDTIGELKSWVRYTLQNNSRGRGRDIFEPVYPVKKRMGIWRLK